MLSDSLPKLPSPFDSSFMSMTGLPKTSDQTRPCTVSTANKTTNDARSHCLMMIVGVYKLR